MTSQRKDNVAQFTQEVERSRDEYLRMKEAGDHVTAGEIASVRQAYEDALEKLSGAFHAARLRDAAKPRLVTRHSAVRSPQPAPR